MARSEAESKVTADKNTTKQLVRMIREGRSFSGNERNVCFLNLGNHRPDGGPQFSNISWLSGLDTPDDSRAVSVVDWDADGDLDLWVRNRNAPRLRYFQNDCGDQNGHAISFLLTGNGTTTNRNALGARLELTLSDGSTRIRTVRAGENFLSQSSLWQHFGLGHHPETTISELLIRWPDKDRTVERFTDLKPNGRYRIKMGQAAERDSQPTIKLPPVDPSEEVHYQKPSTQRIGAITPVLAPTIRGTDFSGNPLETNSIGQWTVVKLWASWCPSCLTELEDLVSHASDLKAAKIRVIALSVDEFAKEESGNPETVLPLLQKLAFPFEAGFASQQYLDELIDTDNFLTMKNDLLSVPMSILMDPENRVIAVYKGPLDLTQLLQDIAAPLDSPQDRIKFAAPLGGSFVSHRETKETALITEATALYRLGRRYEEQEEKALAIYYYDRALKEWPEFKEAAEHRKKLQGTNDYLFPESLNSTEVLEKRRDAQLKTRNEIKAPTRFSYTDQQESSGLNFLHRIVDCAGLNHKSVHYDHGNGMAVADINGDHLLDIFFVNQAGPNALFQNLGNGKFQDITESAGLKTRDNIGVAASFADLDNDGDPDLYVTNVRSANRLFLNQGDGTFTDASAGSGIDYNEHSSSAVFFDYDRDGLLDLFLCVVGEYTTDELAPVSGTPPSELTTDPPPTYYVGHKDGFGGHLFPKRTRYSRLFRNLDGRTFEDVTEKTGLLDGGWTGAATPVDFNRDGFLDLYVLNMQGHDRYWENVQGKTFIDRTTELFPNTSWGAMGVKSFDYNNDGHLDLFVADMHSDMSREIDPDEEKLKANWATEKWPQSYLGNDGGNIFGNSFFENQKNGTFLERSDPLGLENYWPWGISVGDLNADGWTDAFLTASMNYPFRYGVNSVFLNNRGTRFHDAEFILGVEPRAHNRQSKPWFQICCSGRDQEHPLCQDREGDYIVHSSVGSRSSVVFDIENDGDLDIITSEFGDRPQVLVSNLSDQHPIQFLKVRLQGTQSNRDGLGARVVVKAGDLVLTQVHDGMSGYLGQSSSPLYFGLGQTKETPSIEVHWPSGKKSQIREGIKPNSTIEIQESP